MSPTATPATPAEHMISSCSFCGQPERVVGKLVAGPGVSICDECVALATELLEGRPGAEPHRVRPGAERGTPVSRPCLTTSGVEEPTGRPRVDDYVCSADEILWMPPAVVHLADRIEGRLAAWVNGSRNRRTAQRRGARAAGRRVEKAGKRFEMGFPE